MPSSILEDSVNLKGGGKSTLKLLFLLGITILIYLSTNIKEVITWMRNQRATEVSSEFIPSKPEELSFLLPKTSKPRTTSEKKEREEKIVKDMNTWTQQILLENNDPKNTTEDKEKTNQFLTELTKTKDPKTLIRYAMKMGSIHPMEVEGITKEAIYFNLYLDSDKTWKTRGGVEAIEAIEAVEAVETVEPSNTDAINEEDSPQ